MENNMSTINPFSGQKYISLETFRKSGLAVQTPVWFAQTENEKILYVVTGSSSGKAKRIRNKPEVRLVPSNGQGKPKGNYIEGIAQITEDKSEEYQTGLALINKKYGFMKKVLDIFANKKEQQIVIVISLTG
jgi:uncharacterized protein